jgi:hypothetical protein
MILVSMSGLLPQDERGIKLAIIEIEDFAFTIPFHFRSAQIYWI